LQPLKPSSITVKRNQVEVSLVSGGVMHAAACRRLIFHDDESTYGERLPSRFYLVRRKDEVQIVMRAGLLANKRVDTPATIQPYCHACCFESAQCV
jgi:hypothetical protein